MIFKNDVLSVDPAADGDARVVEVKIRLNDSAAVSGLTNLQVDVQIQVDAAGNSRAGMPENFSQTRIP